MVASYTSSDTYIYDIETGKQVRKGTAVGTEVWEANANHRLVLKIHEIDLLYSFE